MGRSGYGLFFGVRASFCLLLGWAGSRGWELGAAANANAAAAASGWLLACLPAGWLLLLLLLLGPVLPTCRAACC